MQGGQVNARNFVFRCKLCSKISDSKILTDVCEGCANGAPPCQPTENGALHLSTEERNALVLQFVPMLWRLASKLSWMREAQAFGEIEDIFQQAAINLMQALARYKSTMGASLLTFVYKSVYLKTRTDIGNKGGIIRIPQHMREAVRWHDKGELDKAREAAAWKDEEWEHRVHQARVALNIKQFPIKRYKSYGDEFDDMASQLVVAPEEHHVPHDEIKMLNECLTKLTPRHREILEARYGIDGKFPLTLDSLSQQFGVTRERIRQLEVQAMKKIALEVNRQRRRRY